MAFKELKLVIIFVLSATLIPLARTDGLVTSPEGDRFVLPAGRPFSITCDLTTKYTRIESMTWRNNRGEPIKAVKEENIRIQEIKGATLKLVFSNPTLEESGLYICRCVYEDEVMLFQRWREPEKHIFINFYNPELKFQSTFENVTVEENTDLVVNCSATGDEPIKYKWHNQYQEVISSNSSSQVYVQKLRNKSVLKIRNISSSEEGSYTCTASNEHGQARKEYEILICSSGGKNKCTSAPYVRHVQVVNLTANSVQFRISVSGAASSIVVRYSTKSPNTVYEEVWKLGDTYEVRGLDAGNSYSFRFQAVPLDSSFGQTTDNNVWSNAQEVIMLPLKPDVVLHTLSGGTVKIERNRINEDKKVDKYKLMYFPITLDEKGNWAPSSCPITTDIPTCSSVDYTISGLSSKTYYELQLQAHTASGYGEPYKQKIYVH